jgi:hypothetical protein
VVGGLRAAEYVIGRFKSEDSSPQVPKAFFSRASLGTQKEHRCGPQLALTLKVANADARLDWLPTSVFRPHPL